MGGCRRWIRNVRSETGRVVLLPYLFLLVWNKRSQNETLYELYHSDSTFLKSNYEQDGGYRIAISFWQKAKLPNTIDGSPKTVEIDCLVGNKAYEIKWKDATTDGDHIKKEHKRVRIIKEAGYTPVRIMFFESNRTQAISIQAKLRNLYNEIGGEYYAGEDAFKASMYADQAEED